MTDPDYEQAYMVQLPAPPDVVGEMPDPTVELCGACVDAYRNGIEPGGTACENVAPGWFGHYG